MTTIDARGDVVAQLRDAANNYLTTWREDAGPVPEGPRATLRAAEAAISRIITTAVGAAQKVASLRADDTLYPDGRDRLIGEALAQAQQSITAEVAAAEGAAFVADTELYATARLPLERRDGATARQDAVMILDGARTTGNGLTDAVERLATRQDAVGALVTSEWLRDYLTARGEDEQTITALETLARQRALRAAADQDTDTTRRNAARTAMALPNLDKARDAALHAARMTLDSASE